MKLSCGFLIEAGVSPRRHQGKPVYTNTQGKEKILTASITKDGVRQTL